MIQVWEMLHPRMTMDMLGFIPEFMSEDDPRPLKEQINDRYISGWNEINGFKMDPETKILRFPGDPPLVPLARTKVNDEEFYFYECAIVAVVQPDGTFNCSRLD